MVFFLTWATAGRRGLQVCLLLAVSYLFYMAWSATLVLLLLASTLLDFAVGRWLAAETSPRRRQLFLVLSLSGNLGLLGFFKYYNFLAGATAAIAGIEGFRPLDVALPIGISFYTFQSMSYTIDIYRRRMEPTRSLLQFALFVAFFPQLVAGPIVRASSFLPQLARRRRLAPRRMQRGLFWIALGLLKKLVVADALGLTMADPVFSSASQLAGWDAALGCYAYTFQLYFDFSAYCDIALGSAALLGFRLPVNFRHPLLASSPRDFWRRWHLTLTSWLRDYLYFPLGGNRKGPTRTCVNIMATMLLSGLWHGAAWSFVFWGFLQGAYLLGQLAVSRVGALRNLLFRLPRPGKVLLMLQLTCFSMVFIRAGSMDNALRVLGSVLRTSDTRFEGRGLLAVALVGVAVAHFGSMRWIPFLRRGFLRLPAAVQAGLLALACGIAAACSYRQEPFIYFQF